MTVGHNFEGETEKTNNLSGISTAKLHSKTAENRRIPPT